MLWVCNPVGGNFKPIHQDILNSADNCIMAHFSFYGCKDIQRICQGTHRLNGHERDGQIKPAQHRHKD